MSKKKKALRSAFRIAVFRRDDYKCVTCGFEASTSAETELDAHHITNRNALPSGGYVPENGISLCKQCHIKAEIYHSTEGQACEPGFHPDELYSKIGSSYAKAHAAAMKL